MIPKRQQGDEVETYLRRLATWASPRTRQSLLLEARRHLYDATARYEQLGLSHGEAQRAAVAAFGSAWRIGLATRGLDRLPAIRLWWAAGHLVGSLWASVPLRPRRHPKFPAP